MGVRLAQEILKCTKCTYVSQHYKMYHEVERKGSGRRSAQINVGVQIGIANTSIGNIPVLENQSTH